MRRTLAWLLAFSIGMSSFVTPVFAQEETGQKTGEPVTLTQISDNECGDGDIAVEVSNQSSLVNVTKRNKTQIINYAKTNGGTEQTSITYAQTPNTSNSYAPGKLSDVTLNSALNTLNLVRYIAGLDSNVVLNESYNEKCQAGMLLNYLNDTLSHNPSQPSGVSDELYKLGYSGASSSNIAWTSWSSSTLNYSIIDLWLADEDSYNIDRLGHR